jgi:hypothetical protein
MIALLLLSIIPQPYPVTDSVDVIEKNHFYDDDGKLTFSQWIFWKWNARDSRYDVVDWRLVQGPTALSDASTLAFWDQKDQVTRRVRTVSWRETWTQYDREAENRKILPESQRRKLTTPKSRKAIK